MTKNNFESVEKTMPTTGLNSCLVNKPPTLAKHVYGAYPSTQNNGKQQNGSQTTTGIRNSDTANGQQSMQNNTGMAESLRAQIATPRNNQVN